MKCVNCGTDNILRDRTANFGRCKLCHHTFAFEPTSMGTVKFTDVFFAKAIKDISANDSLFFTEKQFYYLLDKRLGDKAIQATNPLAAGGCLFSVLSFLSLFVLAPHSKYLGFNFLSITIGLVFFAFVLFSLAALKTSNSEITRPKIRKAAANILLTIGWITFIGGVFASITIFKSYFVFLIAVLGGMTNIYLGIRQRSRLADSSGLVVPLVLNRTQVQEWLGRWQSVNQLVTKLLPSPRQEALPAQINPDVTAYSFDRVVVCDRAELAQFLIANNFHFEHNCAVLSITGYPPSIFSTVMEMLRRNPDLKVYAFHDCTPRGLTLVHHLQTSESWFAHSNVEIFDVGLTPQQVMAGKNLYIQFSEESTRHAKQMPVAVRDQLYQQSIAGLAWIDSGKFVELESFSPQRLLQILTQGIAKSRDPDREALSTIDDGDTGVYIFAVDSFG